LTFAFLGFRASLFDLCWPFAIIGLHADGTCARLYY